MRFVTLLALASVLAAGSALAQTDAETASKRAHRTETVASGPAIAPTTADATPGALFFDGFETSTDGETPPGWTVENVNGDDRAWGAIEQPTRAHTGSFAAAVFWNSDAAADDWLFSPAIPVTTATSYTLTFWFKPGDAGFGTAESLEVWVGEGPVVGDMSLSLVDLDAIPAGDYQQVTATFTAGATMDVHLGFHCDSAADQYFCAIDDVRLDATPVGPSIVVSPGDIDFGDVAVGSTATVTVTVANDGSEDLTGIIGSVSGDLAFELGDTSGFSTTLAPGASQTQDITFTPTADGAVTGGVSWASNDPDGTLSFTLTGTGASPPANDDAGDAIVISGAGTYTGSNLFASTQDGEPDPSCASSFGSSVFFDYTAGGDGTIDISLDGSEFDTVLTIHNPADLAELGCNDDNDVDGLWSEITGFSVVNGTRVLIRIGGYQTFGNGEGAYTMTLTENFGTAIGDDPDAAFALGAPRPNPTAGTFGLDLRMAAPEAVRVAVYDVLGREVAVVHDGPVAAGATPLTGSMGALPSGQYLVRATGASFVSTRSLTVVR